MAKIRLRMGPCEVEIESGDFYVDNDTASAAIDRIARSMQRVAAPRAQVLAASEEAAAATTDAAAAGTADAGSISGNDDGGDSIGRAAGHAGGSRPLPTPAAAASTAAAAPLTEAQPMRRASSRAPRAPARAPAAQRQRQCSDLSSVLDGLDEAEVFEPEFDEPRRVPASEVASRLGTLAAGGFFGEPRTVTETVDHMAERGWLAGPLDVSKALARMSMGREMRRETRGYRTYYCEARASGEAAPPFAEPAPAPAVPS